MDKNVVQSDRAVHKYKIHNRRVLITTHRVVDNSSITGRANHSPEPASSICASDFRSADLDSIPPTDTFRSVVHHLVVLSVTSSCA